MPEFTVYALKSQTVDWIYVGFTSDIERRLNEHNSKKSKSTKAYAPFELVYSEIVETRAMARFREKQLKTSAGKRFIRSLL